MFAEPLSFRESKLTSIRSRDERRITINIHRFEMKTPTLLDQGKFEVIK